MMAATNAENGVLCCRWPTVTTVAQKAFTWRLRVLPYHYSAFFDSHTYGCSVMRPLYFPFPGDVSTYYNNYQWMLGDALLVAPILSQGTSTLSAYFPQGVWYNLYNYSATDTSSGGQNITVQAHQPHCTVLSPLLCCLSLLSVLSDKTQEM